MEFGFEPVTCESTGRTPIYIVPGSVARDSACVAVVKAIPVAEAGGQLSGGTLAADSLVVVVVRVLPFERIRSMPTFPDSGLAITFDLVNRDDNIIVVSPGIEGPVDVSWVPEGLKY